MKITPVTDLEEMFKEISKDLAAADTRVNERQKQAKVGDYFIRIGPEEIDNLIIYGVVIDPSKPASPDVEYTEEDLKEIENEAKVYDEPHMRFMKFTRCFSQACEDGELGDTHCSTMHKFIRKDTFDMAQGRGWPTSTDLIKLLKDCGETLELDSDA